jgi:hypothetical protein
MISTKFVGANTKQYVTKLYNYKTMRFETLCNTRNITKPYSITKRHITKRYSYKTVRVTKRYTVTKRFIEE